MPRQKEMYLRFALTFVFMFPLIFAISAGGPTAVLSCIATAFFLLLISPFHFWYLELSPNYERRKPKIVFDWRRQSWSFYGDGLLLMPAIIVAVAAWHDHRASLPWWSQQWWWLFVAAASGLVFGAVFRSGDNDRYLPESLDGPAKVFHDRVLIPIYFGMLIARVFPLFWAWDGHALAAVLLLSCWGVSALLDGLRSYTKWNFGKLPHSYFRLYMKYRLDSVVQHVVWDKVAFEPLTK